MIEVTFSTDERAQPFAEPPSYRESFRASIEYAFDQGAPRLPAANQPKQYAFSVEFNNVPDQVTLQDINADFEKLPDDQRQGKATLGNDDGVYRIFCAFTKAKDAKQFLNDLALKGIITIGPVTRGNFRTAAANYDMTQSQLR